MTTKTVPRSCKILHDDDIGLVLQVTEKFPRKGDVTTWYQLARNPNDPDAWRLLKLVHSDEEPLAYDCHLKDETCDCKGCLQHDHCRHLEALLALRDAGKLPN